MFSDTSNKFYCPKCGGLTLKKQNFKKLVCDNNKCLFAFYLNVAAAVAVIIVFKNNVLLTVRSEEPAKGKWDLPGGFVDKDETLEEAAKREVYEELDITVNSMSYLCSYPNKYLYKGIEYSSIDSFFVCGIDSIDNIRIDSKEIKDYKLVDLEILDLDTVSFISIRKGIETYRKLFNNSGRVISVVLSYLKFLYRVRLANKPFITRIY